MRLSTTIKTPNQKLLVFWIHIFERTTTTTTDQQSNMARSKDAIERRAQKRNKSVAEQSQADLKDMKKQQEQEIAKRRKTEHDNREQRHVKKDDTALTTTEKVKLPTEEATPVTESSTVEPPESKVENVDSHQESEVGSGAARPGGQAPFRDPLAEPGAWYCQGCGNHNFASRNKCHSKTCPEKRPAGVFVPPRFKKPNTRHDESTSRKQVWAKQADGNTLEQNRLLREKFVETGGEGMEEEDVERAKILIARDERKKNKKKKRSRVQ
jgi:hypothetical protein